MRKTEREWTSALFLLRASQIGLSMTDLEYITIGMVLDMYTELANDSEKYPELATQADFDAF